MTDFLLLGTRRAAPGELSPASAAIHLSAVVTWHRWLRRWGLLRAFAVQRDPWPTELPRSPSACLVVRASGAAAARGLATDWGRLSGYEVAVLPLVELPAHRPCERCWPGPST